jgi:hypothetical protein
LAGWPDSHPANDSGKDGASHLAICRAQGYRPILFNSESPGGMMSPIMMPIDPGVTFH